MTTNLAVQERALLEIERHAQECFPRESCGFLVVHNGRHVYIPCENVAPLDNRGGVEFIIRAEDQVAMEDRYGTPLAVVHSHPNRPPLPSQADRVECERTQLPWVIIGWPNKAVQVIEPSGYRAPLIGREFSHGVLDCYSLIRDYYAWELGIVIPDFPREDKWWLKGQDLYKEGFPKAGFLEIQPDQLRPNDVVLMETSNISGCPNHGGVIVEGTYILQHVEGRLSSRDVYGGYWRKVSTIFLRHKDLLSV